MRYVTGTFGQSFSLYYQINPAVPTPLVELTYTHAAAGNVTSTIDGSTVATGTGGTLADAYDPLGRLQQVKQTLGGSVNERANFIYNDDSSLNQVKRYADDGGIQVVMSTYGYDRLGRLTGLSYTSGNFSPFSSSTAPGYTFGYDLASNMTSMTPAPSTTPPALRRPTATMPVGDSPAPPTTATGTRSRATGRSTRHTRSTPTATGFNRPRQHPQPRQPGAPAQPTDCSGTARTATPMTKRAIGSRNRRLQTERPSATAMITVTDWSRWPITAAWRAVRTALSATIASRRPRPARQRGRGRQPAVV